MKKIERVDMFFEALRVLLGILIAFAICIIIIALMSDTRRKQHEQRREKETLRRHCGEVRRT